MPKRPLLLILFPIATLLWLVGWTLFWLGSTSNQNQPPQLKTDPETGITCQVQLSEELLDPTS